MKFVPGRQDFAHVTCAIPVLGPKARASVAPTDPTATDVTLQANAYEIL